MILLLALLSVWPSRWYAEYSVLNWDGMAVLSESFPEGPEYLAAQAISLYGTGTGDPGAKALEAVLADSSDHRGWTALALVSMRGDSTFMDSIFTTAFSLNPSSDPVLLEIYGYWLLTAGRFQEAGEAASLAVEADSSFGPAWLTLSMAYLDSERLPEALEVSAASVERFPECIPLLHQYGEVLREAGMLQEAAGVYRQVTGADSTRISAWADLGVLLNETGPPGPAVKVFRTLVRIAPDYGWAWGELAALQYDLGHTAEADSSFSRAVELNPGDAWALYRLGRMRSGSDPQYARDLLEAAVEVSPDYSAAWQELAFVYENLNMMSAAEAALEEAILLTPDAWLYGELGYVRENLGLVEAAAEAFETSILLDSQYLYGWQRRGEAHILQGDTLSAREWFATALDSLRDPDPVIIGRLGSLTAATGMPDSARVFFEMALELNPHDPALWLDLARAVAETGDNAEALVFLDSSLATGGDTLLVQAERVLASGGDSLLEAAMLAEWPGAWVTTGWDNISAGFRARAVSCAEKGLENLPEDPGVVINLGELFGELGMNGKLEYCYEVAAGSPARNAEHAVRIANHYFRENRYGASIDLLIDEYADNPENTDVATALAEAYLFDDRLQKAEDILLEIVQDDPLSVYAICYLGLIEENRGNPSAAADRYLEALRLQPGYGYAEDRLRFISGEDYDPWQRRSQNRMLDWNLWINLSSTGGNTEEQYYGGGGGLSWNYGSGSSVDFETSGNVEIKDDRDLKRSAWASLSVEHFLSDHLYGGASSSWDRQPLTVRPWQVSSYLAAGWKSWPADWIWVAPETGAGLVNTRWKTSEGRTDRWTVYGSCSLWAMTRVGWLPSLWLSGSVYIPPEEPGDLVASAVGELEFNLPGPVSLVTGTSLDYTRTPAVESWKKLDSEIYIRLRL